MAVLSLSADEKDGLGKHDNKATLALLPKAVEADRVTSDSPLLGLPLEILGGIVDLIADDQATLAALALVNSDCRQLARSHQFAKVRFDCNEKSNGLLVRLLQESVDRRDGIDVTNHASLPPFVGPCIRKARVHLRSETEPGFDVHESAGTFATSSDEQSDQFQTAGVKEYIATFRDPVLAALSAAMPNLESFSWHGGTCLDATPFFRTIIHLPIRHLKVSRFEIGEPTSLDDLIVPAALPLESISFGASLCIGAVHRRLARDTCDCESSTLLPFMTTLLRSCRTTLKYLELKFSNFGSHGKKSVSFGQERILFPRLRDISLCHIGTTCDEMAWSSLFSAPLRRLVLPWFTLPTPIFREALSGCEVLRHLEGLEVPYLGSEGLGEPQAIVDFISRHPHLQKLAVSCGAPEFMDSCLLPCLSDGRWSNLTSLMLAWEGPGMNDATQPNIVNITAESLVAIGKIESLEQLYISAGIPNGWRHQWLIDHDVLRSSLGGLRKLRRLALSRDTYFPPGGLPYSHVEGYYEYPILPLGGLNDVPEWTDGESIRDIWERGHRGRMIQEAEKYAALLPGLEWIYCGQWPMDIRNEQTSSGVLRSAVPLGEKRDSNTALPLPMFLVTKAE
jgi:hypothetical protein